MHNRFVLYSEELGVYLGSFIGLGCWSKLETGGQDSACVFSDERSALQYAASWKQEISGIKTVAVKCKDAHEATIAECQAAGLPDWNPNSYTRPGEVDDADGQVT